MKNLRLIAGPLILMLALAASLAIAADEAVKPDAAPQKIVIAPAVNDNEARTYKVVVTMTGRMPVADSKDPVTLDAVYTLKMQHQYGHREGDGLMPLEIGVSEIDAASSGQKLSVPPSMFPKLTLLLDRQYQVSNFFGIAGTRYATSVPGINYANLFMLFNIPGEDKPHAIGENWQSKVKLPGIPDTYSFTSAIKSVDQNQMATIHQDVVWNPQKLEGGVTATTKGTVDSVFQLANGKLIKSSANCAVTFTPAANSQSAGQDQKPSQANIKIDISLAK